MTKLLTSKKRKSSTARSVHILKHAMILTCIFSSIGNIRPSCLQKLTAHGLSHSSYRHYKSFRPTTTGLFVLSSKPSYCPSSFWKGSRSSSSIPPSYPTWIPNASSYPKTMVNTSHRHSRLYSGSSSRSSGSKYPNVPDEDEQFQEFLQDVTSIDDFFASPDQFPTFESLGIQSPVLLRRVKNMLRNGGPCRPSAVQAASFAAIQSGRDVSIGAETGSGKTLAYLLPLIDDILQRKKHVRNDDENTGNVVRGLGYDYARAVILVPNKELANQVLRMAMALCGGQRSVVWDSEGEYVRGVGDRDGVVEEKEEESDIVRVGIMPGGFKSPEDYKPIRMALMDPTNHAPLDLLITTPASLGPIGVNPKNINMFADIQTVVIDEADMLFDGGYLRPLNDVLLGFKRADKLDASFGVQKTQHVLVAATLPNMGLRSADAYIQRKFPFATRVTMKGMHNARHYGLRDQNVWIQDDVNEPMPKKRRMERLIQILLNDSSNYDNSNLNSIGLKGEKVMIFLNSAADVDSATTALCRAGLNAIPFHAKIPLMERTDNLNKFRRYDPNVPVHDNEDAVPILVCTDLAARGLDIPGVTSVVQLQFAGNVVSHLHRMGRCGRAGKRDGRGVIFYGEVESELVKVVQQAEMDQERMVLQGNDIEEDDEEEQQQQEEGISKGESTGATKGKVQNAFSRKRGFTKKRKKIVRKSKYDESNWNDN